MATAGIGMAANIVGGELQGWAALLDKWAMGDQYNKEIGIQQGFQNQAGGIVNQGIQATGSGAAQQAMQQGAQSRQSEYQSVNATPLSVNGTPLGGAQNARNSAYAGLLGGQRAKLGSYGDWLQNQWMANQGTARGLKQVTNFAQGQAQNVFPLQMYKAQHSMDDLAAIGQAISSIGGGATNYASLFNTPQQTQGNGSFTNIGSQGQGGYDLNAPTQNMDLGVDQSTYALG